MNDQGVDNLKTTLKEMIVAESDKDIDPHSIADDEALFGMESSLQLDSLDIIQLTMAVQKRYGVRVSDSKQARRAFATVNDLAAFIRSNQ